MKKIFLFGLVFIIFILLGIKLYAQLPKLNNAFYYSSGIIVDSKGNAFVTGKNNRIIKISPEGKAELFAGIALVIKMVKEKMPRLLVSVVLRLTRKTICM